MFNSCRSLWMLARGKHAVHTRSDESGHQPSSIWVYPRWCRRSSINNTRCRKSILAAHSSHRPSHQAIPPHRLTAAIPPATSHHPQNTPSSHVTTPALATRLSPLRYPTSTWWCVPPPNPSVCLELCLFHSTISCVVVLKNFALRLLSEGKYIGLVPARSIADSVFTSLLLKKQIYVDDITTALHHQAGSSQQNWWGSQLHGATDPLHPPAPPDHPARPAESPPTSPNYRLTSQARKTTREAPRPWYTGDTSEDPRPPHSSSTVPPANPSPPAELPTERSP